MSKRKRTSGAGVDIPELKSELSTSDDRLRPRKVHEVTPGADQFGAGELVSDSSSESFSEERPRKSARRTLSHISVCEPAFPRSQYDKYDANEEWQPEQESANERDVVLELKATFNERHASEENQPEYTFFTLDNFSVYRPDHKSHAYQLASLDRLKNRGCDEFLFDGTLSVGDERRFVQGVRFGVLAIDGYGDPEVTELADRICIQSPVAEVEDVWYQLGTPAREYGRFLDPFLWLAQFAKYFVDYLLEQENVSLNDFRGGFYGWLYARYSNRESFRSWLEECSLRDFRTTVAAHVGFLWKECYSIDNKESRLLKHRIWTEADPMKLTAIPRQPSKEKKTIVTPFVYACFRHMYFAAHLEPRGVSHCLTLDAVTKRKQKLGLTPFRNDDHHDTGMLTPSSMADSSTTASLRTLKIARGDVVCVRPDPLSRWKSSTSTWYAYVQNVRGVGDCAKLDILWLYEPSDTTLGAASYPFSNELFLSDNCACGRAAIEVSSVIGKADVSFFARDPSVTDGLFVRQKFRTIHDDDTYDFVSLKKTDFKCACSERTPIFSECRSRFLIGATVLYREYHAAAREDRLEPGQVVDFLLDKQQVVLRRLRRKKVADPTARPNELVVTEELVAKAPSKLIRHCQLRFFHPDVLKEGLPTPYNQNGAGDFFFVVDASKRPAIRTDEDQLDVSVDRSVNTSSLPPLEEGWDSEAAAPQQKLKGMGIFCGGGNFDRGLEDGGAVEFEVAIDYAEHALHTYRANAKHPDRTKLFLGSVDDYLAHAMAGSSMRVIARVGGVEVLAAGSPCPGFSRANNNKLDLQALRNSSMVASVVSYVDFYSPQYCLLENVVPMTQGMGPNKDENVFAQILAAFVAMGYQVQQFLMDAWSVGSSQGRSRVFIVASAPGCEPFEAPPYTHAHPDRKQRQTKLGFSSNGKPFGVRREDYTPFDHVTPMQATSDLPDVGDSLPQLCTRFPDHRTPREDSNLTRACIAVVPAHPRGMGFVEAIHAARGCEEEQDWCSRITGLPLRFYKDKIKRNKTRNKKESKVYARIYPDGLFPTLLTALRTNDGINGRSLHWDQPRTMTVMEARRAQGYSDEEVIVGSTGQQMKIIGNSVDRKVSLALGLCLRKAWLKNDPRSLLLHRFNEGATGKNSNATEALDGQPLDETLGNRGQA